MRRHPACALLLLAACHEVPKPPPPPTPVLKALGDWTVHRNGEAPILALGPQRLYLSGGQRAPEAMLPGLALGNESGPRFGYLGGLYAPLLALPQTDLDYQVEAGGTPLRVTYRPVHARGTPLEVTVLPPLEGRSRLRVRGAVLVLLPADRTEVAAEHQGHPSYATTLTAGSEAFEKVLLASRIDVDTKPYGRVTIETDCVRPRLFLPVARGSTSVLGVALGPDTVPDPFYAPPAPPGPTPTPACGPSATSTLTFSWP